ncbi:unnamed protein product [Closterium sp. NIES-54]
MAAPKRVLRYLCSTSGMGLVLGGQRPMVLTGHADASWADDQTTERSSQGYIFSLGSGSVSWRSTRSSSVLSSSYEAEIYAGAMAAQELRWLTYLLTDLGEQPRSPPVLYVDNKAMLALCREHRLEHRTKHIALRYFLARELQQRGQLCLAYVASEANTADIFTKALAPERGIKRLISLPYAHQQQGVAERMNRTLQNTMRKLLRGMRLPNHQLPEAMDHAVMLHNLLSSSSLPNNASSHLLWTGKQGSTKMLRVFDCMVQYRPPSARAGRFSQRAQWGLHLGIEKNYNAWKILDAHSKETVAARDVIFYERLTLPTYLANLEEDRDPTVGFRGDRHFASAADEADWDEQIVDEASEKAGPLPYCSVGVPMDDENPRESANADVFYHFADNGYVTPAEVSTNEAECIGPNFIPDPEAACHNSAGSGGGEHREKWREAMDKELKALKERNTWKVVPFGVARSKTVLTGKWVFCVKTKADGTIDKFKARWVVRGFDQEHGRVFTKTFALVSQHTSLRILLAIAAMKKKKLRQIDVANAFLYAHVDAEIFVELPHGSHGEPNKICQLQKSLYGIKQAPRLWQQYLHARLIRIGFRQLPHDQGVYRLTKDTDYILLIVYVDDLLYIGSTNNVTTWFEGELQKDLTLTVSSTVTQYLGLKIQEEEDAIYLNAAKYADTIAKRFALTPTTISTPYRYTAGKEGSAPLKPAGIRDY